MFVLLNFFARRQFVNDHPENASKPIPKIHDGWFHVTIVSGIESKSSDPVDEEMIMDIYQSTGLNRSWFAYNYWTKSTIGKHIAMSILQSILMQ